MRVTHYFSIILLLFIASSCSDWQNDANDYLSNPYKTRILLNIPNAATRSQQPGDEVERVDVLIFNGDKLDQIFRNITSFSKTEDGRSYVEISLKDEGVRQIYIVANNDNEQWLSTLISGTSTLQDVINAKTTILKEMASPPFVLSGIATDVTFSETVTPVECQLQRTVARIDVVNKAEIFKIQSVRLLKAATTSTIFPSPAAWYAPLASFDSKRVENDSTSLYCYENKSETPENSTQIEIHGEANGIPLSYVVQLKQDDQLIAIERNSKYTIYINEVRLNDMDVEITVSPWMTGNELWENIVGGVPDFTVTIAPEVGTYSAIESTVAVNAAGGLFRIETKANAQCGMRTDASWLNIEEATQTRFYIDGQFTINCQENTSSEEREGVIILYNKLHEDSITKITVKQEPARSLKEKYMVVVVAGQSNAVGYDWSEYNEATDQKHPKAFQLSYRRGDAPNQNLSIIPLEHYSDDIGPSGAKGIHLPLAKEIIKYIPNGYKVLVIPVAQGDSNFGAGRSYGSFNWDRLAPNEGGILRWGYQSAYAQTIIERTKHVLDMNPDNKFIGVVWCQGESDTGNPLNHYQAFAEFTQHVFGQLSAYAPQTAFKSLDKRLWFTYSTPKFVLDWYSDRDATGVVGGYKLWNPNNFIHLPDDTPTNPGDPIHFGQNAFATVIAPLVAQRMNATGALFNAKTSSDDYFLDKTTETQAVKMSGSMNDSDVSTSLELFIPFRNSLNEMLRGNAIIASNTLALTEATGLQRLNGSSRTAKALTITSTGSMRFKLGPKVSDWSVSFLAKRIGGNTGDVQAILTNAATSNSPFIGFKKYTPTAGIGGNPEFIMEPIITTEKKSSIPGLFVMADNVRDLQSWVHYVVTFNNTTKVATVYMNGAQVGQQFINTSMSTAMTSLTLGYVSPEIPGANVQLIDLGIWSKVLQPSTVKKLFLMSYYDYTR